MDKEVETQTGKGNLFKLLLKVSDKPQFHSISIWYQQLCGMFITPDALIILYGRCRNVLLSILLWELNSFFI